MPRLGVSDNIVRSVRSELEAGAQLAHQSERVGKDGVKQPAKKSLKPKSLLKDDSKKGRQDIAASAKASKAKQIPEGLGIDDKTVGAVRSKLEAGAEIPHHDQRTGKDGKSKALDLWLDCHSQREIAEQIGVDQKTVGARLGEKTNEFANSPPPASRQHFDGRSRPRRWTAAAGPSGDSPAPLKAAREPRKPPHYPTRQTVPGAGRPSQRRQGATPGRRLCAGPRGGEAAAGRGRRRPQKPSIANRFRTNSGSGSDSVAARAGTGREAQGQVEGEVQGRAPAGPRQGRRPAGDGGGDDLPEVEKGGRETVQKPDGISKQRISQARVALAFAPGHAANVLAETTSLDQAHAEAKRQKATVQIGRLAAMAVAVIYPDPAKAHRGRKGSVAERFSEINKSQRVMAMAKIYPEPEERGRGKKDSVFEHFFTENRTVLKFPPERCRGVQWRPRSL